MTGHSTPQPDGNRQRPPQVDGDGVEQLKDILERHIDQHGWRDRLTTGTTRDADVDRRDLPRRRRRRG